MMRNNSQINDIRIYKINKNDNVIIIIVPTLQYVVFINVHQSSAPVSGCVSRFNALLDISIGDLHNIQ